MWHNSCYPHLSVLMKLNKPYVKQLLNCSPYTFILKHLSIDCDIYDLIHFLFGHQAEKMDEDHSK